MRCEWNMFGLFVCLCECVCGIKRMLTRKEENQSNKLLDYCFNDNVIYCMDLAWFFFSSIRTDAYSWFNPRIHFCQHPYFYSFTVSLFFIRIHLIRHFYNTMHTDLRKSDEKNATVERTYMKQTKEKFPFYVLYVCVLLLLLLLLLCFLRNYSFELKKSFMDI